MEKIAILKDNEIFDLQTANELNIDGEDILFDNSPISLDIIRHSTAHLMAEAIKILYPEAKFFVGPTVDEGFYYDFRVDKAISDTDLKSIEKEMKKLIKKKAEIIKQNISKDEALERFKDDDLKLEVLKRIPDNVVSIYSQGNFEDLCRGPHVPNVKMLHNFKLTRVAGAYLGGDEKREMLTRIYGIAFADKESLKEHMNMLEEAKKRDHRKLGNELELFTFSDDVGAGLPLWLPKGARLRAKLEQILFKMHRIRGYEPVRAPEILKSNMWEISGHYQNYGDNMYLTDVEGQEYGMKPMNCLGHIKIYESKLRSYKDLPLKFFEYGVVHRHEKSGVLHGLLRVREFTQDDAHIYCTQSQIKESVMDIIGFVDEVMNHFGFNYTMELATKPEKAIGEDIIWEKATTALKEALEENNLDYKIDEGGGAFYGPKIDIKITDALNRKWQCGTLQVDFNLPERFGLTYIDENNEKVQPVMLHRAVLGSFERFIAILIEHFAGEFPFSIAPTQVSIIPIADAHNDYAKKLQRELQELEIDSNIFNKNDSLNKRIRNAEKQRVPMIVVIGDDEVANETIALRDRRARQRSEMTKNDFLEMLKNKKQEDKI